MKQAQDQNSEAYLNRIWASYRDAVETPDHGIHFMPQLWDKIEARRGRFISFEQIGRIFLTVAAGLSLAFGGVLAFQNFEHQRQFRSETYIEILSSEHASADTPDLAPFLIDEAPVRGQANH